MSDQTIACGVVCPICLQMIPVGTSHVCPTWAAQPIQPATIQYVFTAPPDYTALLTRIAVALERIE